MKKLEDILNFSKLLNKFREVERVQTVPNSDRRENSVEHSYQLAMLAWYIVDTNKLSLDKNLILQYALVHDFVEIYAGDTYTFSKKESEYGTQKQREHEAYTRLKNEYNDFNDLHSLIEKYEKREDKESKFVHALDKIQAHINVYLENGKSWKRLGVTIQMIIDKKNKLPLSPEIEFFFNEFIALLKEKEGELFNKN